MTVSLELPSLPPSQLQSWDPRWKLVSVLVATSVAATLQNLLPAFTAFVLSLILIGLVKVPWQWYLNRISVLWPVWIGLGLLLPFFVPDQALSFSLGPIPIGLRGFLLALRVGFCATSALTVVVFLLATTPIPVILQSAHALRVPSLLVQLVALTYRYFFLLVQEIQRLRIALRVRGYRSKANLHTYRTVGHVTGLILVRSAERAERVGQAMRCRGYTGRFPAVVDFQTRWRDVLLFVLIMLIASGLAVWDRLFA